MLIIGSKLEYLSDFLTNFIVIQFLLILSFRYQNKSDRTSSQKRKIYSHNTQDEEWIRELGVFDIVYWKNSCSDQEHF